MIPTVEGQVVTYGLSRKLELELERLERDGKPVIPEYLSERAVVFIDHGLSEQVKVHHRKFKNRITSMRPNIHLRLWAHLHDWPTIPQHFFLTILPYFYDHSNEWGPSQLEETVMAAIRKDFGVFPDLIAQAPEEVVLLRDYNGDQYYYCLPEEMEEIKARASKKVEQDRQHEERVTGVIEGAQPVKTAV